jgi:hypothetical protein
MAISPQLKTYIPVGNSIRNLVEQVVDDFFVDFDTHVYLRGQPGVGKTFIVAKYSKKHNTILIQVDGNITKWAFTKLLCVYLDNAGWPSSDTTLTQKQIDALPNVAVFMDDCPNALDGDFIDTMKIALDTDEKDYWPYNVSLGGQYKQAEKFERDAMDKFRVQGQPGLTIPFYNKVKFIFTMNHALVSEKQVEAYKKSFEVQKKQPPVKILANMQHKAALDSRVEYHDLQMTKNEYWGWIADLLLNEKIIKGASKKDCEEMLQFLYDNWSNLRDKSVRMVKNKLWKHLQKSKYRKGYDYKARWYTLCEKNS